MAGQNTAVFGIYKSSDQAGCAVDQIVEFRTVAGGFTHHDISVLLPDTKSSHNFAHEKHTKAPEETTTGVTTGGVSGGSLGLLPRLAGLGVGGDVGGLVGALVGMGLPESEAKRYEGRVNDGAVLLSVHCETSDQISRAKDLLKRTGAEDISFAGEKASSAHDVHTETARVQGLKGPTQD